MKQPETIIIVDNDETIRRKMYELLIKQTDYEVLLADTGNHALEMIALNEGKVDLVVTDLVLDGIDGIGLINVLRRKYPEIKILICSSLQYVDPDVRNLVDGVLIKSFRFVEFLERVKRLVR